MLVVIMVTLMVLHGKDWLVVMMMVTLMVQWPPLQIKQPILVEKFLNVFLWYIFSMWFPLIQ